MKHNLLTFLFACVALIAKADDGSMLWLRQQPVNKAVVTAHGGGSVAIAKSELSSYFKGNRATLRLDASMPDNDGFEVREQQGDVTILARRPQ